MTSAEYPVVIVGGGPVGLALAVDLGLRGVRCLVVERKVDIPRIPKGQNLTQRTMESFSFWGVEEDIRAARVMPDGYPNSGVTAYRDLMSEWSYPWWRRSAVAEFYARSNERIPQYETERVLRNRVAELHDVEIIYGWEAEQLDGAAVGLIDPTTGGRRTVSGRYVVGCDGSNSTIRDLAGIPQDLSDHNKKMALLVFRSPELNTIVDRFGEVSFFNIMDPGLDGYWKFLGRVDADGEFFFHAPVPSDAERDSFDFSRLLHESVGAGFGADISYVGFWDLRFAVAKPYRRGDVFVAGDAAHSHPPYGGYGINTGLEDVRNLGWKLAATIQGWGGGGLLDSYDAERRPVFESTARDFIEKMIDGGREFLARHDPHVDRDGFEAAWEERRERSKAGVSHFEPHYGATPSSVGVHSFLARPGHHLPPSGDLFERLGPRFTLLAEPDEPVPELSGLPVELVRGDLSSYGSRFVLVRPDHFVAWVGDELDGFEAAVAHGSEHGAD